MTRRHLKWKSAVALLAGAAAVATTATHGTPITMTEASWTDNIYATSEFHADTHAGINYANSISSNGTLDFLLETSGVGVIPGSSARVNNKAGPDRKGGTKDPFVLDGRFGFLYFKSEANACARVGEPNELCPPEPNENPIASAYSSSKFYNLAVKVSENTRNIATYNNQINPIVLTASCRPGVKGAVGISTSGAEITLRHPTATTSLLDEKVRVPTSPGEMVSVSVSSLTIKYTLTLEYKTITEVNKASSAIHLELNAITGIGTWDIDIILASAECGLSREIGEGVVFAPRGTGLTMNAVVDEVLAGDLEAIEAGTLDDALKETELTEADKLATTTTEAPKSENEAAPDAEGTSTSPSTGATSSAVPEIAQQTVTGTSESPSTSNKTTTRTTGSSPLTSSRRSTSTTAPTSVPTPPAGPTTTSTSAAPAIVIPDEPGKLSPTARLEEVGTANVDEDELVVVVKGDELPADAKRGAAALEIWLRGGNPGTSWETFASTDPDSEGWRWAAINQTTGTVVYIR